MTCSELMKYDGFSSSGIWMISPQISSLFSRAHSISVIPAAHTHPPFPPSFVDSFMEQIWREISETDAELRTI